MGVNYDELMSSLPERFSEMPVHDASAWLALRGFRLMIVAKDDPRFPPATEEQWWEAQFDGE